MATITTTLRPAWRLKMIVIIGVAIAIAIWGYIDAAIVYPARGERFARLVGEYAYLDEAAGPVDRRRPLRAADVSIPAPAEALADLLDRRRLTSGLSELDKRRVTWLQSLAIVGRLDPAHTTYTDDGGPTDPDVRLAELTSERDAIASVPNAMHTYDIPIQWIIFAVGVVGSLWCGLVVVRTAAKKYTYDTETKTLTLPSAKSFTTDDIDDIDKRKWHKFYVTIKIREDHPTLAGKEIEFDLYRRARIEDWILEMERTRFPERIDDEQDPEEGEAQEDAGEPAQELPVD